MTTLIPLFLGLACGDKDTSTPTDREPGDSGEATTDSDPSTDSDEPTDSGDPQVETVRWGGNTTLETASVAFRIAGAEVTAGEASTHTDIWGDYVLDVPVGSEVCVRIPGSAVETCSTEPDIVVTDTSDLSWGRMLDNAGNVPVSRGVPTVDATVTTEIAEARVGADGHWVIGGSQGKTAIFAVVLGMNTTKESPATPLEAVLESGENAVTWDNLPPKLAQVPVVTDGTSYWSAKPGAALEVDIQCEDPDGDACSVEVVEEEHMVVAYLSDGRGGVTTVPVPVRRSSNLIVNDVINAEGDVGYDYSIAVDGTTLNADDHYVWTLAHDERMAVTVSGPDIVPTTQHVYPHGSVVDIDADLKPVTTTTFSSTEEAFISTADKSFQFSIPGGSIQDGSGNVVKAEVELAYYVYDVQDGSDFDLPRLATKGDQEGAVVPTSGVYLQLRNPKDPTEVYDFGEGATMWLQSGDKLSSPSLYSFDHDTGVFDAVGSVRVSGDYATVDLSGLPGTLSSVVADLEEDIGCIRVYVPGTHYESAPHIAVDDGTGGIMLAPTAGPLTVLAGLPLNATYTIGLWHDGRLVEDTTVNTSSALLSSIDEPAPYDACVDLTLPSAPPSGVFLTRKFMDVPALNTLLGGTTFTADDVGLAYLKAIDPNADKRTFEDWLNSLDWSKGTGASFDPRQTTGDDTLAIYGNDGDLGFGREMHLKVWDDWDAGQTGEAPIVAMYTTNYASVHEAAAGDPLDVIATVAMEYSPHPSDPSGPYYTKFFVWLEDGTPLYNVPLDDFGAKPMPDLCTNCHGGEPAAEHELTVDGSGDLVYPNDGRMEAYGKFPTWIPYAVETFGYTNVGAGAYSRSNQEDDFLLLNEAILMTNAPTDSREMIHGWYGSTATTTDDLSGATLTDQNTHWMPSTWDTTDWNGTGANGAAMYEEVYQPYCRSCHLSFPNNFADPTDWFVSNAYMIEYDVCTTPTAMPQAQVTQNNLHADIDARLTLVDGMTAGSTTWTSTSCPE